MKNTFIKYHKTLLPVQKHVLLSFLLLIVWNAFLTAQTTVNLTTTEDTYLNNQGGQGAGQNNGTCTELGIRVTLANSIFQFDVSSIPPGATIISATLNVYQSTASGTQSIEAHRITTDWPDEGPGCALGSTAPSFNAPWTTPGGDFDATVLDTKSFTTTLGYYSFDVTTLIDDWSTGTFPNYGILLKSVAGSGELLVRSKENAANTPPYLEVVYSSMTLSATATNESCTGAADGTIDLTVTNGTAPITYAWSDGGATTEDRTGLVAGTYTVTVTDANESKSTSATVGGPIAMGLSTLVTPLSTPGATDGAINLTIEDGTAPFTYLWSNGATTQDISALGGGTYTVTVTDACSSTASTSVNVVPTAQKYLYLTDPTQGLDRIDPVATMDATTVNTANINAVETAVVADGFDTNSYTGTNSTGSLDWTSDWIETDQDGGGSVSGGVRASGNALQIYDNNTIASASREVDLSSVTSVVFSFDFVNAMNHANDNVTIELSKDGGATYPHVLAIFDRNTTNGNKVFAELVGAIGALTTNTRIRFRVSGVGGAGANYSTYDNITFAYTKIKTALETFTQGTAMCDNLSIQAGEPIIVTNYVTVTSGTMPANPNINAVLRYGATNLITLVSPTYNSGTGLLTWSGTLGSSVSIPAGQAISLDIISNESGAVFQIDYDSQTKPSKIQIPTTTYIYVEEKAVYDAPYPGGSIITEADNGTTVYLRATVTDPFGFDDITGMDIKITDGNGVVSNVTGTSVATAGCTRTYEYVWNSTGSNSGIATIDFTANEGTEGVTHTASSNFELITPLIVTKTLVSPATAPYTVGETLTYNINIDNQGNAAINSLPLRDIFSESCLEFVSATPAESSVVNGTIFWNDLGALAATSNTSVTVNFTVIGNCDPADNIARVQGAKDANGQTIKTISDTLSINIDERPIANEDKFCVSGTDNLAVLANDTDPDNDLTTVTITVAPTLGSANVNLDNTINYSPDGSMADNDFTTFTYQVCDNAPVTPFCATARVTVVYSTLNDAPTLFNDNVSTTLDLPFTFNPLENDTDIDGSIDPTSVTITSNPTFGAATVNADGTIYYEPNPGFSGVDNLTYQVCDNGCPGGVECSTATVSISVIFVQYVCTSSTSDMVSVPVIADAVSYTWDLPAGTVINSGDNTNMLDVDWSGVTPGQYTICALATNDCGDGTQTCQEIVVNTLVLSTIPTDVLCSGENTGAIDLTATGGIPAYNYNWDNGSTVQDLSSISAGTYNVTVTDKYGCVASTSETLIQPATALSLSGTTTPENPFGNSNGTINITAAGGTPVYDYVWSNGSINEDLTGLNGGTYFVTVTDANGCIIDQSFTVNTVGGPLTVTSIIPTDANCFGGNDGTIDLEVIGGTEPYTYEWDNDGVGDNDDPQDLTGLSAGTYNVTITDNVGATTTSSATVNEPATAVTASTTGTNVSCNGNTDGAVDLTASGGTAPLTYNWSTGNTTEDLMNVAAGTYDVTITDANGCTTTASQTITEPAALIASGVTTNTPCDPGNTGFIDLTVSGGAPGYTYNWSNGETTEDISGLTVGNYSVTITDANSCTSIKSFTIEGVCVGIAKRVSSAPVNNNDGTYSFAYEIKVKNEGNVALANVQVVEDLDITFGTAIGYQVDLLFSSDVTINSSFDGTTMKNLLAASQVLAVGDSALITLQLTVTPGTNLGVYNNSLTATANSNEGVVTTDISQDGIDTDPDNDGSFNNSDPTPVSFTENPIIGIAKTVSAGPTNNGDGTYNLTYRMIVRNMGDVPLTNVQVMDNLTTTFSGAPLTVTAVSSPDMAVNFPGYDGTSNFNLLAGTDIMQINEIDTIFISLTVAPASIGPHDNSANASGVSPAGMTVTDISQDGTNVDPTDGAGGAPDGDPTNDNVPTPVIFTENPEIGLAKTISSAPVNNMDGTYTLTYQFLVKNTGDVPLSNVQVTDDLSTTFSAATGFVVDNVMSPDMTVNFPGYDGSGTTTLLAGTDNMIVNQQDTIYITLTVTPGANLGPYNNTATANGTSPIGTNVDDISQDGTNVDPENDGPGNNSDPTPVLFTENPIIGIAKSIFTQPVSNNDGTYTLTYQLLIDNKGDVPLLNVQVTDDLSATFTGATGFTVDNVTSPDMAVVFPGYDGLGTTTLLAGTDVMAIGEQDSIYITVTVTPGTKLGIYYNSATADATGPSGTPVTDDSYDGINSDPDSNGDPTDNTLPTPVRFVENRQVGVAKVVSGVVDNLNGTFTVSYDIKIENTGDVPLTNIHAIDNLSETYLEAASFSVTGISSSDFTVNTAFNGDTDIELLTGITNLAVGDVGIISIEVLVNPGGYIKPFNNKAAAYGSTPGGAIVLDNSTDGTDVDPDGDDNPSNNSTPTPVQFPSPIIGTSKAVTTGPTYNGDGTLSVTYDVGVKNFGAFNLFDVQLFDTLTAEFGTYLPTAPVHPGEYTISAAPVISYVDAGSALTANAGFTGEGSNTSLVTLNSSDVLEIGDSLVLSFTIQFVPFMNKTIFENQVLASGDRTEDGIPDGDATDLSDDGTVIDEDGDGIPTEDLNNVEDDSNENDPTIFEYQLTQVLASALQTCFNNNTGGVVEDDYYTLEIIGTSINGGATNQYQVVVNANVDGTGGEVLATATYGTSVVLDYVDSGNTTRFTADGSTTYDFIVRDVDENTFFFEGTTMVQAACSDCPPAICFPIKTTKKTGTGTN